jgi:membrane protease YdiL (CAAX protease family)
MSESSRNFSFEGKSPISQLLFSFLIIFLAAMFLFPVLLMAGAVITGNDLGVFIKDVTGEIGGNEISIVRFMVISQEVSIFIIPAIIILSLMKPGHQKYLMDFTVPELKDVIIVIVLAFCIFPVTGFAGRLNAEMHFPDWLNGVEGWMKEKENYATQLLDLLITSKTLGVMVFNIFMLAVIPAIGEELIFRGVFQKIFYNLFKSGHLAIWLTACAFSALHFQFFGFLPRFILGLVFGYLFYWSGTLWLPVVAHFINNAVPVAGAYFQGWDNSKSGFEILKWQQFLILPLTVMVIIVIFHYFRNKFIRRTANSRNGF